MNSPIERPLILRVPLYRALASAFQAIENCRERKHQKWAQRHTERAKRLVKNHMPSGAGFDNGTTIDLERSTPEKLVFTTSFHHMDPESGMYDGWTEHTITVRASLQGIDMTIGGRDRNQIKDYMSDVFREALTTPVDEYEGERQ